MKTKWPEGALTLEDCTFCEGLTHPPHFSYSISYCTCVVSVCMQELFTFNQHLLDTLGVGHPALQRVCSIAQQFGLAAKLTGAGGGGCAIALIPPGNQYNKVSYYFLTRIIN